MIDVDNGESRADGDASSRLTTSAHADVRMGPEGKGERVRSAGRARKPDGTG